ncbi:hypothetical protein [Polymorphobacter megasporae]|uniref:hypothetical protein n=1 Tax=Glacieibacterium megasporae TaxID=2835787 RepID=UPI001C1E7806|nr:hypothetical protein [Polymorphobacter megasporae]UAJ09187.1 hypothetical protein KTC28_12665 [Polymorphobacter megasporae]
MNARQKQAWFHTVWMSIALFLLSVGWTAFSDVDRIKQSPASFVVALLIVTVIFLVVLGAMRLVFTRFVR